jgi:hypothetical protein
LFLSLPLERIGATGTQQHRTTNFSGPIVMCLLKISC